MIARVLVVLTATVLGAHAVSAQPPAADVQRRLAGHWRLVSFVNFDEKGGSRPSPFQGGRITYDTSGQMTAQLTHAGRKPLSQPPTDAERIAAQASYLAYYGRFEVDATKGSVTHHVEGSTNPNWPNTQLVRFYEFSPDGNRLMLSVKNNAGRVTGTLTWERLQ
jgi:hypothetical protein